MKNKQIKCKQEWIAQGKKNNKPYLFFQEYCLDLTNFINFHPGGKQVINNYLFKDMTDILFNVFPHNRQSAPKILKEYRIGKIKQVQPNQRPVKITGPILKHRKQERMVSLQKKTVQFPSQIARLASIKQKMQEQKLKKTDRKSRMIAAKSGMKRSNRTKNMNPNYLQKLKGNKWNQGNKQNNKSQFENSHPSDHMVEMSQISINKKSFFYQKHKQQPSIHNRLLQGTQKVSINNNLKSMQTIQLFPTQYFQQSERVIKIPIMNIRLSSYGNKKQQLI